MIQVFADDFTGNDSDPWDSTKWDVQILGGSASATIQANQGRLTTDAVVGSNVFGITSQMPYNQYENLRLSGKWTRVTGEPYHVPLIRFNGVWVSNQPEFALGLRINPTLFQTTFQLLRWLNGSAAALGTYTILPVGIGDTVEFILECVGDLVRANFWKPATESKPEYWRLDNEVSGVPPGGAGIWAFENTDESEGDFDDIVLEFRPETNVFSDRFYGVVTDPWDSDKWTTEVSGPETFDIGPLEKGRMILPSGGSWGRGYSKAKRFPFQSVEFLVYPPTGAEGNIQISYNFVMRFLGGWDPSFPWRPKFGVVWTWSYFKTGFFDSFAWGVNNYVDFQQQPQGPPYQVGADLNMGGVPHMVKLETTIDGKFRVKHWAYNAAEPGSWDGEVDIHSEIPMFGENVLFFRGPSVFDFTVNDFIVFEMDRDYIESETDLLRGIQSDVGLVRSIQNDGELVRSIQKSGELTRSILGEVKL